MYSIRFVWQASKLARMDPDVGARQPFRSGGQLLNQHLYLLLER